MRLRSIELLAIFVISLASSQGASGQSGCFCLQDPDEGYFLWGCQDETPKNGFTKLARCWDREIQKMQAQSFAVNGTWKVIQDGEGSCKPCRPIGELDGVGYRQDCNSVETLMKQCIAEGHKSGD